MRIQHRYLTFEKDRHLLAILDKLIHPYKEITKTVYALEFLLYEDDSRFALLQKSFQEFDLEPSIGTEYDNSDFENAALFTISTGEFQYPYPGHKYEELTYNLNAHCPICGIGKEQKAPFRLNKIPAQKNSQFWGLHWEYEPIFVRKEARDILVRESINGITFQKVLLHRIGETIEGFYQMHIHNIFSGVLDSYNTKMITCKISNEESWQDDEALTYCGRLKYHHPRIGGYTFNKIDHEHIDDIAYTSEYFGSGASANRLPIVSKRFKEIVETNKLKGLQFIPIMHSQIGHPLL